MSTKHLFFHFILLSCSYLEISACNKVSKTFKLLKPGRSVTGNQPYRVEAASSEIQCLMQLVTLLMYFLEITKTSNNQFICKLFRGKVEDFETVSEPHSNIYGPPLNLKSILCQDHKNVSCQQNGVYEAFFDGVAPFEVYCDMNGNGGGWTTIQRRFDGSVDFARDWDDYKNGFGDPSGEYWLGLDRIHAITKAFADRILLRIEVTAFDGDTATLIMRGFSVDDEANLYKLTCGQVVKDEKALASGL